MEPRDQRGNLERQPAMIRGGRPLLFERLCMQPGPRRQGDVQIPDASFRAYELQALADSVMRELQSLLNTRLPFAAGLSDEGSQSVVNYGLPDFSTLNAANPGDRTLLARLIERKIAAFEPRLRDVHVTLEAHPTSRRTLVGTMNGNLQLAAISEPVCFPVTLAESGVAVQEAGHAG
jgi:type VI secretion system protein ImpF